MSLRRRRHERAAVLLAVTTVASACSRTPQATPAEQRLSIDGSAASVTLHPRAVASTRPVPPVLQCRVTSLVGQVTMSPLDVSRGASDAGVRFTTVAPSMELDVNAWVDLAAGGSLVAQHPSTLRETAYRGPGRFRACVAYAEETWLATGHVATVPLVLERPGAEAWLMTPSGAVLYSAADVEVTVTPSATVVQVRKGAVHAWTGDRVAAVRPSVPRDDVVEPAGGWVRVDAPGSVTLSTKFRAPEDGVKAGVARCLGEAKATKALSDVAPGELSETALPVELASKRSLARLVAHAACGVASLRANLLPSFPARDATLASLNQAALDWRAVRVRDTRDTRPKR